MGLLEEIDSVIAEVREAKPVPLSASVMVNRRNLLTKLERIRHNVPEELHEARYLMQDRDGLMTGAQAEIDQLRAQAYAERDKLVSRTEIVAAASREADKIIEESKKRARQIRVEAEDYVDAKLASFEVVLQKTLGAVTRGRESLRGRLDVAGQHVPTDAPGEVTDPRINLRNTGSINRV